MNPRKSIITILLVTVSLLALYFFVLPEWNKLNDKKAKFAQAEQEQQRLLAAQQDLENFLAKFQSLSDEAYILEHALPLKQPEFSQILAGLDEMAQASGLVPGSINFTTPSESQAKQATSNSIQTQEVLFSASGSYQGFINFLLRAENSLRIIDILNVDFKTEDDTGTSTFNLKFLTYYQI